MEYKHFSHKHTLNLCKLQPGQQFHCHGCQLPCQDSIYACWKCNFFLHEHCGNANRYVKHPSHPLHPLVLLPTPTYCGGSFLCNCCGTQGSASSYCCRLCEIDLHVHCAYLPPTVSHRVHQHELALIYGNLDRATSIGPCNICKKDLISRNWSYFCDKPGCNFQVHTFCATNEVKIGFYQDDEPNNQIPVPSATPDNANRPQAPDLTPEEFILETARLRMEFEMAQALGNIIAYYPH